MNAFPIIRVISKLLIPYILLFGFYVQFHGDYGPGGGFQAGVILASALILYGLVFGLDAVKRVAPPSVVERMMAVGILVYAGTGLITIPLGGNLLNYDVLEHDFLHDYLPAGQHLGIFAVEFGVGITVTAVMTTIFYTFAERGQGRLANPEPTALAAARVEGVNQGARPEAGYRSGKNSDSSAPGQGMP